MKSSSDQSASRRRFMQFLAASPLIGTAFHEAQGDVVQIPQRLADPISWGALAKDVLIKNPGEALSVFDFELPAQQKVPMAHFAKVATGSDDEFTMRANRAEFGRIKLRPRRLRDVSMPDSSITLFGAKWDSPVFICPTGATAGAMHADGNIGVSKAAEAGKHLQILAATELVSIEDCMAARGGTPIWFQVNPFYGFELTRDIIMRGERAGSPVLVLTIDQPATPKFETLERLRRLDQRRCTDCHQTAAGGVTDADLLLRPSFRGITPERWKSIQRPAKLDWDFVRRLRDSTRMKVVIKGIITPEDAVLSVKYGFDGIIVSNHGGRAGDFGTTTIEVLSEIAAAVNGRIPILVDSGFRRGMDVIKALALGATAVGIGRPYLWGLGAFGQAGVERVLEILRVETRVAMAQVGATQVKDLIPEMARITP